MKGNYLITTDSWFIAPDGQQYKAVWGNVEILSDAILGVKTNARSANWFAKVGSEFNHVIIAGCQIHYACRCEVAPESKLVPDYNTDNGVLQEFKRPTPIYLAL